VTPSAYAYVVTRPFGSYVIGTMITNGATITDLTGTGQIANCVRVNAPTSSGASA